MLACLVLATVAVGCEGGPLGFDGNGGEALWRYRSIGLFNGRPGVDGERVFIAVHDTVIALDQETGRAVWKAVPSGVFIAATTLQPEDGVLYVSNNGHLFAYDAATGVEHWRTLLTPAVGRDGPAIEVGASQVYVGKLTNSMSGPVYAVDRASGAVVWQTFVEPEPEQIVEVGNLVCVASEDRGFGLPQGAVSCLSAADGSLVWRFEVPDFEDGQRLCEDGGVDGRPAVVGDRLVFGEECGQLFALDLATGEVLWRQRFNTPFDTDIVVDNEKGYACTRLPACFAFRLEDGGVVWSTPLGGSIEVPPIIISDNLLVLALVGFLSKIDLMTGVVKRTIEARTEENGDEGFFFLKPVHHDGRIFSGGGDFFFAIRAP